MEEQALMEFRCIVEETLRPVDALKTHISTTVDAVLP